MNSNSSGSYIIDKDYYVVNVNDAASKIYPQLKVGEKCYKCLMNFDEPCEQCPVKNNIKGPRTYLDPIRNMTEIVDAVEINSKEHGLCYALIFNTVGRSEDFAVTLPKTAAELQRLSLVKALTSDYLDVFAIDLNDESIIVYRFDGKEITDSNPLHEKFKSYSDSINEHIEKYIYEGDRKKVEKEWKLENILKKLSDTDSFTSKYRVSLDNEIHYYFRKFAKIGLDDSNPYILVAIGCENDTVKEEMKRKALEKILTDIEIDSTTGLYTKEAFFVHAQELLKKYKDISFDFCMLKINNIRSLTYQYGNVTGDDFLNTIGKILRKFVTEKTCLTYMGNGVFAMYRESTDAKTRKKNITEFTDEIKKPGIFKNAALKWSVYVDVNKEFSVEEIYNYTNYALSTISDISTEDYIEFDQSIIENMRWEQNLEANLEEMIKEGDFVVWYQPKYSAKTKEIIGAEALVRLVTEDGKIISPVKFIPILEKSGKVSELDEFVFKHVCELQNKLEEQEIEMPISVNLSRTSLFIDNIVGRYAAIINEHKIEPKIVPLEITESAAVRADVIKNFSEEFAKMGFVFHVDDFGAGYSSLGILQEIKFESIKVDKTLIDNIGNEGSESLIKHVIEFAHENGKKVIAEGVETIEQFYFLKVSGCDAIQGYFFSKPLDENSFVDLISEK